MVTLRIVYKKQKYMRFLSHLELMKLFERVFRLNKLPLKFSEGFNPHPKMTFASPLSVGFSSQYEIMEVQLNEKMDLDRILAMKFPDGIEAIKAAYVETKTSLMASIGFSEYFLKVELEEESNIASIKERVDAFLNQSEILYEKKTKKGTLKSVNALEQCKGLMLAHQNENEIILRAILASSSEGSLNPVLLAKLFLDFLGVNGEIEVERIKMLDKDLKDLFLI